MVEVELDELIPKAAERESTAALVSGMAGLVKERGYEVGGFDVYAASEVLPGSGLSSSAACEVLLGVIENRLFCGGELYAVTIAQLAQRAEMAKKTLEEVKEKTDLRAFRRNEAIRRAADWVIQRSTVKEIQA